MYVFMCKNVHNSWFLVVYGSVVLYVQICACVVGCLYICVCMYEYARKYILYMDILYLLVCAQIKARHLSIYTLDNEKLARTVKNMWLCV
jgi:hypothetical protein